MSSFEITDRIVHSVDERPVEVLPCGCRKYPHFTEWTELVCSDGAVRTNSGTEYMAWTDSYDCQEGHE